jgi:hypothetical protein
VLATLHDDETRALGLQTAAGFDEVGGFGELLGFAVIDDEEVDRFSRSCRRSLAISIQRSMVSAVMKSAPVHCSSVCIWLSGLMFASTATLWLLGGLFRGASAASFPAR